MGERTLGEAGELVDSGFRGPVDGFWGRGWWVGRHYGLERLNDTEY